jgi:general secretion pathway protein D
MQLIRKGVLVKFGLASWSCPVRLRCVWALVGLALMSGCAQQRIRAQADEAIEQGQYEQAVQTLQAGAQQYPDSALLRSGLIQAREAVLSRMLTQAATLRATGKIADAQQLLKRALPYDSSGTRVQTLLDDLARQQAATEALAKARTLVAQGNEAEALAVVNAAQKEWPADPELQAAQRQLEIKARQKYLGSGQLALSEARPISVDFRDASLRTVLDVITRNSGINFIFDKDLRTDSRVTVLLRGAKVEDAIDLIVSTHQLAKKVVDKNTILIYPNTPDKKREHEDQIVKVFYLSNAEAKGAAMFLKSMLKIRDPFVDERANMVSIRESAEMVLMAERLLTLYDSQEPEVLMDVEVIEVSSNRLTQLGVKYPDTFSLTPLNPGGGSTGLTLGNVTGINADRIGLSVSGLLFNLKREVGDVNVLANPKIRARNKEKAKILIGDKIPVVTATVGTGGFVSDSVNYLDVGLKLEVEPTVYINDEVSIKVGLEVSSLGSAIKTSSGTQAYQIGTRNASTNLRLRDGETQLLAGLISREDRTNASRVPGAGDLPVLGRLFSSQEDNAQRTELVLAITPRIVRNQRYPDVTQTELWVGTEAQPKFKNPGAVPKLGGGSSASGAPATEAPADDEASNLPKLSWDLPNDIKVGDTFTATLQLKSGVSLRGGPVQITYPKDALAPLEVTEGSYFSQGGSTTSFTQSIEADTGRIKAGIIRHLGEGTDGKGSVVAIKFKAIKSGPASINLTGFDGIGLAEKQRPKLPLAVEFSVK